MRLAWALFLLLGLPFALMAILTFLARQGIYIGLFTPLWQPWPPDLWKPLLGVAVFVETFAYLAYRAGRRRGYRRGNTAAVVSSLEQAERAHPSVDPGSAISTTPTVVVRPLPPPPPPDEAAWEDLDDLEPEPRRAARKPGNGR